MRALSRTARVHLALQTRNCTTKSDELLIESSSNGLVQMILNRHNGKNSFSKKFLEDIGNAVQHFKNDKNIRVLVIKSNVPGVFCAGADLKERATMPESEVEGFVDKLRGTFTAIENLPFPTIASIEGAALGGGLELAMSCDLRIAGTKALIGLPETSLAIIPGAGGTQRLPRIIGAAKAKELIFLSKKLNSTEAFNIGLITESVEEGKASTRANEIASAIAEKGPIAVRMAKKAINDGMQVDITNSLKVEKQCYAQVIKTNDRKEGLKAFIEKRKPQYNGN